MDMSTEPNGMTMDNNEYKPLYDCDQSPIYEVDAESEAEINQIINSSDNSEQPEMLEIPEGFEESFEDIGQAVTSNGVTWAAPSTPGVGSGGVVTINLSFDRTITGLSSSDIEIWSYTSAPPGVVFNESCYWDVSVSGSSTTSTSQSITVTIAPTEFVTSGIRARLKANSLRSGGSSTDNFPSQNVDSGLITSGNGPYFVGGSDTPTGGTRIRGRIWFSFPFEITVSPSDFRVWRSIYPTGNPNRSSLTIHFDDPGWNITLSRTTIGAYNCSCRNARSLYVTATPTGEKGGYRGNPAWFNLVFALSNLSLGTRYPNGYASTISHRTVQVNNWPYVASHRGGTTLTANFWSRYPFELTGIEGSDFEVQRSDASNSDGAIQSGWSISVSGSRIGTTGTRYITVTATPPQHVWQYYRFAIKSRSMRRGSSTVDAFPGIWGRSGGAVIVSNAPRWTSRRGGTILNATLQYRDNATVSNITAAAFKVILISGRSPTSFSDTTGWDITVTPSTITGGSGNITFTAIPPIADVWNYYGPHLARNTLNRAPDTDNTPSLNIWHPTWRVIIDTRPAWSNLVAGATLSGRFNFKYNRAITDIDTANGFEIQNQQHIVQRGWSFSANPTSLSGNGYVTITATPPADTVGTFRMVAKPNSAKAGTTTTRNVPIGTYRTGFLNINNRPQPPQPGDPPPPPPRIATASWSNMSGGSGIGGRLTFTNASVTDISGSDFEIINASGTVQNTWPAPTVSASSAANGSYITVLVFAPGNLTGQYRIRLKANSVKSGGSTTNNAPSSSVTSPAVSINSFPATLTPWWTDITGGTTLSGKLNFNASGICRDSITEIDFEVLNTNNRILDTWDISVDKSLLSSNATMIVTASPPAQTDGNFYLQMKSLSFKFDQSTVDNSPVCPVRSDNYAAVDNSVATVATASWDRVTGGRDLDGRITFGLAEVIGISRGDFQVVSSGGVVQTGWDIDISANNTNESDRINVYTDPPRNTNGSFKLRLKALSVRSGGIKQPKPNNAPANNVDSPVQVVNNTGNLGTISWSSVEGGSTLEGVLSITGAAVDRVYSGNFRVKNRSGQLQSGWLFDVSSESAPAGGSITITATPPDRTQNWFYLELRRRSLRSGGSARRNAPLNDISTEAEFVDNIVPRPGRVSWLDITGGTTLVGRLRFRGKRIYGMQPQDFTVVNEFEQPLDTWQITVSHWARNAGQVGTVTALPPANTNGRYKLRLKEITVRSGPTSTDNAPPENVDSSFRTVNNGGVAVAVPLWSSITGGTSITGTLRFTGASVTGISRSDFQVLNTSNQVQSGWSIRVNSSSASNGGTVTITANPPRTLTGSFKLRLKLNSIQSGTNSRNVPSANLDSSSVAIDNTPVPVVAEASWSNMLGGTILSGRLTFQNAAITNLDDTDIDVYEFGDRQDDWIIHIFRSTLEQGQFGVIAATPPENTFGWFRFALKPLSVNSDGGTNNAPVSQVLSAIAFVDNRPIIVARAEWRNVIGSTILSARIYFFDTTVRGISSSAFRVADSLGRTVNWNIRVANSYASDGGFVIVWATPPANTRGAFRLLLLASSVRSGLSRTANAPASTVTSSYVIVDNRPKVIATASWSNVRGGTTLRGQITFAGAAVGGIETSDFEVLDLHNRTVSGWSIYINRNIVFSGTPITVIASPPANTNQSFRLRLKSRSVMSGGSRTNNAPSSAVISSSATVRNVVQLASSTWTNIAGGTTLRGTMTFRLARVTEIDTTDFSVVNISNVVQRRWLIAIATNTFSNSVVVNVTATPPAGTNGSFKLQLNALSVRSETSNDTPVQNVISPVGAPINNVPTYLIATASWSGESGGTAFTGELTFDGADVTNIGPADFEVYNTAGIRQYGWGILVEAASLSDGESITIAAAPPSNTNGSFKVRLKRLSVRSGGLPPTENPNSPVSNTDSDPVTINNIITVSVDSFSAPEGTQRGSTSTFRITFNTDIVVSALTLSDFRVLLGTATLNSITAIDPIDGKADEFDIIANNPSNTRGVYTLGLLANSVPTTADYEEGPITSVGSTFVTFDTRAFSANWFNTAYDSTRDRLRGQIVFSHEVQHISNNDFEVVKRNSDMSLTVQSGWTISYTLNANPPRAANIFANVPDNTNGSFALRLKRLSLRYDGEPDLNGPPSSVISPFVDINNVSYSIATIRWRLVTGGSSLAARLSFTDAPVTGLTASDIEILDSDGNVYPSSRWPISIVEVPGPPSYQVITGIPRPGQLINGLYKFNLKPLSLMSGGSPEENAPLNAIPSGEVTINTLPTVSVSSFTAESGIIRRTTANFDLEFNVAIDRNELTTADFIGGNVHSVTSLVAGDRSRRFRVIANNPSNGTGSYRLVLRRNSIPNGTSYNQGPSTNEQSTLVRYNTRPSTVTASWGTVSAPDSNRSVTCTLTFSATPGATFNIAEDIVMQQQILTIWRSEPIIWTIVSDGSTTSTSKPMRATPSPSVTAGTFRFLLKANALGVGSTAVPSDSFTIGEPPEVPTAVIIEADSRFLTD